MVFGSFTESVFFIRLTDHGCSSQSLGHEDAYLPDCKIYIVESLQSRCIFAGLKSIFKLVPRHWLWLMVLQIRASHGELDDPRSSASKAKDISPFINQGHIDHLSIKLVIQQINLFINTIR